ncbi:SMI1/KNR4 family protein [Fulvivirga ulvae]|uniref:SMI1/KNR4 family protein n=1 Tax=Fulvivirga ulvae TaxID=2904245 RepID=UPI001F15D0E4|nr:SMI1/KNR4 family protein [Fulvivirga ulvae]UII31908.1 SMI1/KNR4 family protein [Fulvivirga ulvae]
MIKIALSESGFQINGETLTFPVRVEQLKDLLGECRHFKAKYNNIFTWDDLGIVAYSKEGKMSEGLQVSLEQQEYKFSPKQVFQGQLLFKGEEIISDYRAHKDERVKLFKGDKDGALVSNGVSAWFSLEEGSIETIDFSGYQEAEKEKFERLPVDDEFQYFVPLWEAWIAETTRVVPDDNEYYNLTHGITKEDIKGHSKLDDDTVIPEALINFYKIHNVEYDAVTSAFSFSVNGWGYDLIPFKDIAEEWQSIQYLQFGDDIAKEDLEDFSPKVKADDYANPKWVPFATGRNGDYLLFDTDPSDEGTYGQIIELQNESWQRNVVADSLADLIQKEIDLIKGEGTEKFEFILRNGV